MGYPSEGLASVGRHSVCPGNRVPGHFTQPLPGTYQKSPVSPSPEHSPGGRWHDLKSVIVPCHSLPAFRLAVGVVGGWSRRECGLGCRLVLLVVGRRARASDSCILGGGSGLEGTAPRDSRAGSRCCWWDRIEVAAEPATSMARARARVWGMSGGRGAVGVGRARRRVNPGLRVGSVGQRGKENARPLGAGRGGVRLCVDQAGPLCLWVVRRRRGCRGLR
jgi:hypothetical protein